MNERDRAGNERERRERILSVAPSGRGRVEIVPRAKALGYEKGK